MFGCPIIFYAISRDGKIFSERFCKHRLALPICPLLTHTFKGHVKRNLKLPLENEEINEID